MRLLNDEMHCEGAIISGGDCKKRDTCLRYTEHRRKLGKGDGRVVYLLTNEPCTFFIEVKNV